VIRSALFVLLVLSACGFASRDLRERAVAHAKAGRLGEAIEAARAAVEVAPADTDSRRLLARLQGEAGRPGAQLRELEAADALGDGDDRTLAGLLARRGRARAALGHVERWRDLERAVELDAGLAGELREARRSALLDGGLARWARDDRAGAEALWARAPGGLGVGAAITSPETTPLPLLAGLAVRAWRVAGLRAWPLLATYERRGGDDPRALRSLAAARRGRDPRAPGLGFSPADASSPGAALSRLLDAGSLAPADGETVAGVLALSALAWSRGERDSPFDDEVLRWLGTQPAADVPRWARAALARLRGQSPAQARAAGPGEVPGYARALVALDFPATEVEPVDPASQRRRGELEARGTRLLPPGPLVPAGCPADPGFAAELARLADRLVASPPEGERLARDLVDVALVPSCRGLAVAELLLRARDPARARVVAVDLIAVEPGDSDALALAFQAALAQRDTPAARLYLEAREAAAPQRGWPSLAAARAFEAAGDPISALGAARQALALGEGPVRRAALAAAVSAALAAGRGADAARYAAVAFAELSPAEQARFAARSPRDRALAEGGEALRSWLELVPEDDVAVVALGDAAALDRALAARPWSITLLAARARLGDQAGRNAASARLARIASGADDDGRARRAEAAADAARGKQDD
jgi:hypothetical protein